MSARAAPPDELPPTPLARTEGWLVAELRRMFAGSEFKSIEHGPGDWSDAYLRRVVAAVPAIRVAWLGGEARDSSELTLDTRWSVFVITGWSGGTPKTRQLGKGPAIGAYRACELAAPRLHNQLIPDVGMVRVQGVVNLWTGAVDKVGVALCAIHLEIPMALDPVLDPATFSDFLAAGIAWDLPGTGAARPADVQPRLGEAIDDGTPDAADLTTIPQGD